MPLKHLKSRNIMLPKKYITIPPSCHLTYSPENIPYFSSIFYKNNPGLPHFPQAAPYHIYRFLPGALPTPPKKTGSLSGRFLISTGRKTLSVIHSCFLCHRKSSLLSSQKLIAFPNAPRFSQAPAEVLPQTVPRQRGTQHFHLL